MYRHWSGISFGLGNLWILLSILVLIGFVFILFRLLNPGNLKVKTRRKFILGMLESKFATSQVDAQEYELRKSIILSEEDEHFNDPGIYSKLKKYAGLEIDSREYFEMVNRLDKSQTYTIPSNSEQAIRILNERYAHGEIDEKEYQRKRDVLSS